MKILIIEDNDLKFNNISNILYKIIKDAKILREKSRNSGLLNFFESERSNNQFDFIICDNYMPLRDNDYIIKPYATEIVEEIRRINENKVICICSSEKIEECNYDYFIKYDESICMDEIFKNIINDITIPKKAKTLQK